MPSTSELESLIYDKLYEAFFKWIDDNYPPFEYPGIGNMNKTIIPASIIVSDDYTKVDTKYGLKYRNEVLFEEWIIAKFGKDYLDLLKKCSYNEEEGR